MIFSMLFICFFVLTSASGSHAQSERLGDCGAHAVYMILKAYNKETSLESLKSTLNPTGTFTTLEACRKCLESQGIHTKILKITNSPDSWSLLTTITSPAIFVTRLSHNSPLTGDHFMVMFKYIPEIQTVVYADIFGLQKVPLERFLKAWTGIILLTATDRSVLQSYHSPFFRAHFKSVGILLISIAAIYGFVIVLRYRREHNVVGRGIP
ncbi:MAG: cysteine peptidase family C39 domain-containing protein [Candidatus Hydrogenedentales bacterium]|jgi:ABC-type bacteriocin/lantibiotic exporter with double-glycine peptidase domain